MSYQHCLLVLTIIAGLLLGLMPNTVQAQPVGAPIAAWLPQDSQLDSLIRADDDRWKICLALPEAFLQSGISESWSDEITWQMQALLSDFPDFHGFSIWLRPLEIADSTCAPLSTYLPQLPAVGKKPQETSQPTDFMIQGQPSGLGQGQPSGALTGKSIFVNGSHGWYYNDTYGWTTQRGNTNGIVEDFINAEAVNQYLLQYLWNSGAGVYTCRERDMNPDEVIIDNGSVGYLASGDWSESLEGEGFYGQNYQVVAGTKAETATASYTPDFSNDGYRAVYIWYPAGPNRSVKSKITIFHGGGATVIPINQQQDGYSWKYLGSYYFEAGYSEESGSLLISNEGSEPGQEVVADAVRFGGGMGSMVDGDSVSGKPRWEESGRYYAEFSGCASCGTSTVSAMPRYAKWESEDWEDSIYFAWHTNAPNPGSGTSTFIYSSAGWDGAFDGVAGSQELQEVIHAELMNDIRAGYDPNWQDRGKHTANFGEVNPRNNDEMPALLIELAFHDTPADAEKLKDPKFRQLSARAIYQGMVKYFARRDKIRPQLLPEPPTHLVIRNTGSHRVSVSWHEPPADSGDDLLGEKATSYKVYLSENGRGFDNGTLTNRTELVLLNLSPGKIYYFRVTALNDGGESLPSETLAVRVMRQDGPHLLIVNGFDRIDKLALLPKDDGSELGINMRMDLERMNRYNYVIEHANALDSLDIAFDSSSNEAVISGDIELENYAMVDWLLGEESSADETFSPAEQDKVTAYLSGGGGLFLSGAEIGWDLDQLGSDSDKAFYRDILAASYVNDDSGSHLVSGLPGGIFEGLSSIAFDDGSLGSYAVDYPDSIAPGGTASANLGYDGTDFQAGLQMTGDYKLVYLALPFESIASPEDRAAVMARIVDFLGTPSPTQRCGGPAMMVTSGQFSRSAGIMISLFLGGLAIWGRDRRISAKERRGRNF
jgi:hypothetical protein